MCGYGGLAFNYSRAEFSVLCVFSLFGKCAQRFRMIGDHIFHVCLIKIIARKPTELIQLFLVICVRTYRRRQAPCVDKSFMLVVICVCSVIIFSANAFTAGFVAFCSANLLNAISFWSDWAAIAKNFLSSSLCALALLGIRLDATVSTAQHTS